MTFLKFSTASRFCLAFCLALGLSVLPVRADDNGTIASVRIDGNQRIENATILSYLSVRAGDAVDMDRIDQSLKGLFATGFFADVSVALDSDVLVVTVKENPVINRIAFEGNDAIKTEDLEKETQLRVRTIYTRSKAQADTQRILDLYRRGGRFAATVEPKIIQLDQNRVDLVFEISEGSRTGIGSIAFVGNASYEDEELLAHIATKESAWWRFFASTDFYDPDRLSYDRELLRRFYLNEGYADIRIVSAFAELTPDREDFNITFTLEEGKRYKFGKIDLSSSLTGLDIEKVRDVITTQEDGWYSAERVEKTIAALTAAVSDLHFPFVEVTPKIERHADTGVIDVAYHISEGPHLFVDRIDVTGNQRTMDYVIRRQLVLSEGDPFSVALMKRSEQRIKDLGFFENVKVTPAEGAQPDQRRLNVDVKEKSTGELSIGAGFSTTDGPLADFSIREKNLLGRGQDLRFSTTISSRTQQYNISFTEPYAFNKDLATGFDLFRTTRDNQSESSYDQTNNGFALRAGYPLSDALRQRLTYTLSSVTISNVPSTASRFIREQEGRTLNSVFGQELAYDKRDSKLDPTEGYMLRLNNDLAGAGGDSKYLRSRLTGIYYYPLSEDLQFNLLGEAGYIFGMGEDVRISDRFFLGGDQLRGFAFAGVGPRDMSAGSNEDALGGNMMYRTSAELSMPIGFSKESGLRGYGFVDAGALSKVDAVPQAGEDFRENSSPRVGAGIGVAWQSPFGPIRVDFGFPVVKQTYDKVQQFRFSFGTRF
jgi:outer membrane protein insertion porin family